VARIALATGAPVVPVGIWGPQARLPRSGLRLVRPIRPPVALAFGSPILPVGDVEDPAAVEAFVERVREHLEAQVLHARRLVGDLG
jgi:1-acyl-sn-glycerol-3-phosphate acyltransferase